MIAVNKSVVLILPIFISACTPDSITPEADAMLSGSLSGEDQHFASCTNEQAIVNFKEAIQDVIDVQGVSFEATEDFAYIEIKGTLIGPDPGFSPKGKVFKRTCRVFEIVWE